ELGAKDDYTVTILIGGEEVWWGEPCFWVETRTDKPGRPAEVTASLISYAAFGDTMSDRHMLWFVRKTINGLKMNDKPDIALYVRGKTEVQLRRSNWAKEENPDRTDSLGVDTVSVPAGTFRTSRLRRHYGIAETAEKGDSSVYYEHLLDRVFHYTPKVPVTNLAQVDL